MHSSSGLNIFLLFFLPCPQIGSSITRINMNAKILVDLLSWKPLLLSDIPYRLSRPFLAFKLPFYPTFWTHCILIPCCELNLKTNCAQSQQNQQPKDKPVPAGGLKQLSERISTDGPKMAAEKSQAESPLPPRAVTPQVMTSVRSVLCFSFLSGAALLPRERLVLWLRQ